MTQSQGLETTEPQRTKIDIPTLIDEKDAFRERIIGQDEAVDAFAILLAKIKSGIRQQRPGPIDIKFLAGPSGVGKTEMVYALADLVAEGNDNARAKVIKLNGGEYQQEHMVTRLVGSPPGYRGSEDPSLPGFKNPALFSQENLDQNRITYKDRTGQKRSIVFILVDEAEKAHDALHRAFLGVLDKGQMTIGNNKSSDFSNAVIFYTSNVGNQEVEDMRSGGSLKGDEVKEVVSDSFRNAFPPEFRGRIRELIVFNNLNEEAIKKITALKLKKVEEDFAKNGIRISLELSPAALEWLIKQGFNPSEGARALEKVIDGRVHDKLVLAHVGINIDGKKIYADIEEGAPELSFYFNEGEQLQAPKKMVQPPKAQKPFISVAPIHTEPVAEQITQPAVEQPVDKPETVREHKSFFARPQEGQIPEIPNRFKKELLEQLSGGIGRGVTYYVAKRDKLVKEGLLEAGAADIQPEIREAAAQRIVDKMRGYDYIDEAGQIVRAGLLSLEEINDSPYIKEAIRRKLLEKLRYGPESFRAEMDKLVKAGIGTEEEWKKLLYESQ